LKQAGKVGGTPIDEKAGPGSSKQISEYLPVPIIFTYFPGTINSTPMIRMFIQLKKADLVVRIPEFRHFVKITSLKLPERFKALFKNV
jgi:hypothetical protein